MSSIPQKQCTKCKEWYFATTEHFHKQSRGLYGLRAVCKKCVKLYDKTREDERREYQREWARNNREKRRDSVRRYRSTNRELLNKKDREKYWSDPNKARERVKAYRSKPGVKERDNAYSRQWQKEHPIYARSKAKLRRDLKRSAKGSYLPSDIELLYRTQKGKCWWCECDLHDKYHIDHRIPLSRGGSNDPSNLVLSCPKCNIGRSNRMPWEWSNRLL